jgi:hypothetical protein
MFEMGFFMLGSYAVELFTVFCLPTLSLKAELIAKIFGCLAQ